MKHRIMYVEPGGGLAGSGGRIGCVTFSKTGLTLEAKPHSDRQGNTPAKNRGSENRPLTPHRWPPQVLSLAATALFSILTLSNAASAEPPLCADILYLIEQSRSQFFAIRGDSGGDLGGIDTTFVLPDASHCAILEDAEKRSYQCTWKHPLGDQQAHKRFQRFVKEMRNCIGDRAEERSDQPVNHPDFYASRTFRLADGEARVTLKNKSQLMSTLVSIGIYGFKETK